MVFAQELLQSAPNFERALIAEASHLAGDASLRTYSRLKLQNAPVGSVILMALKGGRGPVGGGPKGLTQDDTFVELARFLRKRGIDVPEIYVDARDRGLLIVEDVGDLCLANAARFVPNEAARHTFDTCGDPVLLLYERAIDVIMKFQSIEPQGSCVAFQRSPSLEQLRSQAHEFVEHYALPRGISDSDCDTLSSFIANICTMVDGLPKVLSHYDYTAYNLFLNSSGAIRPLDFQDACLESPVRDLIALIDDRDSDVALGRERHARLFDYFTSFFPHPDEALRWYNEYTLHWHFRVSGRFALLSEKRGLPRYAAWLPGSLRRLVAALANLRERFPDAEEVMHIVKRMA